MDLVSHEIGCFNLSEAMLGSVAARTRGTDRRRYDEKWSFRQVKSQSFATKSWSLVA